MALPAHWPLSACNCLSTLTCPPLPGAAVAPLCPWAQRQAGCMQVLLKCVSCCRPHASRLRASEQGWKQVPVGPDRGFGVAGGPSQSWGFPQSVSHSPASNGIWLAGSSPHTQQLRPPSPSPRVSGLAFSTHLPPPYTATWLHLWLPSPLLSPTPKLLLFPNASWRWAHPTWPWLPHLDHGSTNYFCKGQESIFCSVA